MFFFVGVLHSYHYQVVRTNNVIFNFSVANFPIKNMNDLISVAGILSNVDALKLQINNQEDCMIGFTHIKLFIDNFYDSLALTNVELALAMGRQVKVPQYMLKGQRSLKYFDNGEIVLKPSGVVFIRNNKNNKTTKFLFQLCGVEKYTNSQCTNILVQIGNCKKNNPGDIAEV